MISFWRKLSFAKIKYENFKIEDINAPLILLGSLVGLLPHSVKFSKSKQCFRIIPNSIYLNSLCCVAVILLLFSFGTFHVRYMLTSAEKSQFNDEITTQLNYILEVIVFIALCITIYVSAILNRSKYLKILNMIVSTWKKIPPTKQTPIILQKMCIQRNIMLLGLCATIVIQLCVNLTRKDGIWKQLLVFFTFNMPQVIQLILHAFYTMLVITVTGILQNINAHCQFLADGESEPPPYLFINVNPKVKKMNLRQIELIYMKAFDIKTDINITFQGPMLASIMQSFHAAVSEAHILYHGIIVDKDITVHEAVNCLTWLMFQLIKIYSLGYSGSLLKLEALKIGQILHCIPTEKQDLRCFMEVQHFSTLLKYQSIEINMYGYFPLDATLLFNMFAAATMYLIILVQFDSST